jgi:hypothetical protein
VLDKAKANDRADYGRAIAKAASGRALLFASALDRRKTLHRRLKSMLMNPTAGRRLTGRLAVVAAVAIALPLTATRAIEYVDKVAPAAPVAPIASASLAALAAPAAPAEPADPASPAPVIAVEPIHDIDVAKRLVVIDGKTKGWKNLTPEEKAEVRQSIAEARRELAEHRVDREQIRRDIQKAMAEARSDRSDMQRDLADARADVARAMAEIDAHAVEIRRAGHNPEQIKATVRASLKAVENIDIEKIQRDALASIDPAQIEASVAAAEQAIEQAQDELDRLEDLDPDN